jgi:excisionase family DNA binding protein
MANKVWYTVAEASELLGRSDRTVRRQIAEKKLTSRRIKGVVSVYLNTATLSNADVVKENPTMENDMSGTKQTVGDDMKPNDEVRIKDLEIAKLIKDLDETKGMVDWLKKGYENLQATHYETTRALSNLQLQLSPPREEKTAEGEIVGIDNKSASEGIVGAKKAKILSDLTQILIVFVLLGLLIAITLLTVDYFRP